MRECLSHQKRQSPGENWVLLSFGVLTFLCHVNVAPQEFSPRVTNTHPGFACPFFGKAGRGQVFIACVSKRAAKKRISVDFEKELKNLLTKSNKYEILHLLKGMSVIHAQA